MRSSTARKSLVERARILLLSAEGQSADSIGSKLDVTAPTVYKWRRRYREDGMAGLSDQPRPGQPRKLDASKTREILRLTTERIPEEATHWSLRLMAKHAGVTRWQVQQVWQAADLKPHRSKSRRPLRVVLISTSSSTTAVRIRRPRSRSSCLSIPGSTCISLRPALLGSMLWRTGSLSWNAGLSTVASSPASVLYDKSFAAISRLTTSILRSRSFGPSRPRSFSGPSTEPGNQKRINQTGH